MIPRHRPSFGVWSALRTLTAAASPSVEGLEHALARSCGVRDAVLLPSVRAGIRWALTLAGRAGDEVVAPAYTCSVVHEAIIRAARRPRLLDVRPGEFLMDTSAVGEHLRQARSVVLCELFGLTYDLRAIPAPVEPPTLRIIDAAMAVPTAQLCARLAPTDVMLVSCGLGKSCYAGWGALGFVQDQALATKLREIRAVTQDRVGRAVALRRATSVLLRTLAHWEPVYRYARQFVGEPGWGEAPADGDLDLLLDERFSQTPESPEWHVAPTAAERRLISLVLRHAEADCSRREVLVARYLERLRRIPGVRCPVGATGALSHFSIGIPEEIRPGLRERLRASGVDAGLLFPYPSYLPRSAFPNARRAGSEVINLPVHHRVTPTLVDEICAEVSAGR